MPSTLSAVQSCLGRRLPTRSWALIQLAFASGMEQNLNIHIRFNSQISFLGASSLPHGGQLTSLCNKKAPEEGFADKEKGQG